MTYKRNDFLDKALGILQDDAGKLSPTERDSFLQEAVLIYSRHRPREIVREFVGDGTYDYAFATYLERWAKDFSVISKLEYPANERDPEYVDEDDFMIVEKATGQYLRFLADAPLATQTIRVVYTALHVLANRIISGTFSFASADSSMNRATGSFVTAGLLAGDKVWTPSANNPGPLTIKTVAALKVVFWEAVTTEIAAAITIEAETNTIPEIDQDALCNLSASLCSEALASAYANVSDSTISADAVDHKSKSEQFALRARAQRKNYLNHLGIKDGESEVAPASVVKDFDVDYPWGGDRLTHPRKNR